jgi:nucleoside-diphosphate-sugar epimerase
LAALKNAGSEPAEPDVIYNRTATLGEMVEWISVGDIGPKTNWGEALIDVDTVIHVAARVHTVQEKSADPLAHYRQVNTEGTRRLAQAAASASVRRFVYISTIGVNGNATREKPFTENDPARPHGPYSVSKWEAEKVLRRIEAETGLEVVIVRPPLVYGPIAKGNFYRLLQLVDRNTPLPFKKVRNKRSLIGIDNLCDLILRCSNHPNASGETFLAADGEDLSTADLVLRLASALGRSPFLFSAPPSLVRVGARVLGKEAMVQQLWGSLQIDTTKARRLLDWSAPRHVDYGLTQAAHWYRDTRAQRMKVTH